MAIEFSVSGDFIANNANVGTNSSGGNDGAGTLTISNGQRLFDTDDLIVITAENETADGQLDGSSVITGIVVYDSAADYAAGIPKYTYEPQNPGQTANIQGDISGLGDVYVRFNGSVLVSSDPGAPSLQNLLVAPEHPIATGGSFSLDRDTNVDYDGDGVIAAGPPEEGDSAFNAVAYPICFAGDAMIDTPVGAVRADGLRVGDLVNTRDRGPQPVRWIDMRSYSAAELAANPNARPIRITAGALGRNIPEHDLLLSPQHRVLVRSAIAQQMFGTDEVLVAVKQLIAVDGIAIAGDVRTVTYVHFMFDRHEIVHANGADAESLFAGAQALAAVGKAAKAELFAIFPGLRDAAQDSADFARVVAQGRKAREFAGLHATDGVPLIDRI